MNAIETKGLTKKFGQLTAVDSMDLTIKRGEIFALLGPNGAGKTTTIRMLSCLISPTQGTAAVEGLDIKEHPLEVRAVTGLLTENPSLYERLTAVENMEFFAEAYGLTDKTKRDKRIKELLEFFDLWERRNNRTATFSKGMKQKLAIARALIHNPPVLYLDEPTAALDPEASKEIRELIEKLSRQKRTILLSTHRLEEAEKLADRVMIINKGKLVVAGTPNELRAAASGAPYVEIVLKRIDKKVIAAVKKPGKSVEVSDDILRMKLAKGETIPAIVRKIVLAGGEIESVSSPKASLEDAYLKIMKEA